MLLKDNYETFDHPATSGSLSMLGHQPGVDANAVAGLRRAGALILGKAHQDEFAVTTLSYSGRAALMARKWDEPAIIGLAYDYEQATLHRRAPVLAGNPLAGTLLAAQFNPTQQMLLNDTLNQNPWSVPVLEYVRILNEYLGAPATAAQVEAFRRR